MTKEFEELKRTSEKDEEKVKARHNESYQYARSLGFGAAMARRLRGSGKERITRLAKEL